MKCVQSCATDSRKTTKVIKDTIAWDVTKEVSSKVFSSYPTPTNPTGS